MRNLYLFLGFLIFVSCSNTNNEKNQEKIIEKFNQETPYAIEITRERSFYQAKKINNRLHDNDIDSYIVKLNDTLTSEGEWYHILCDNIVSEDSAAKRCDNLKKTLKLEDIKVVKYSEFEKADFEINENALVEKEKISTNKPGINENVYDVINKYPESNSLLLKKTFIINNSYESGIKYTRNLMNSFEMDLPRGINRSLLLDKTVSFSEVIYEDNLYGDQVTIDIGKFKNVKPQISQASIINTSNKDNFEVASYYADLILATGEYLTEIKEEIKVNSYTKLYGYKVTIEPEKNYIRKYFVLTDANMQYIMFCQSTDKTDEEVIAILENIGKGEGLLNYDEFYNTFNTLPENIISNDKFLGFTIDRLDWSYADNRGYVEWSKEMVGHWNASGYFFNDKKGLWYYSIFDLLSEDKQNYIYGDLYSSDFSEMKQAIEVYGTTGAIVFEETFNWETWDYYTKLSEVNFGIGRYVCAIGNSESSWFAKEEILLRAESLQFGTGFISNQNPI